MNAEPESCATCGHPRSSHFRTTTGCGVVMMPGYGCSCTEFTPAPPRPASISDEAEAEWEGTTAVEDAEVVNAILPQMRALLAAEMLLIVERIAKRHYVNRYLDRATKENNR